VPGGITKGLNRKENHDAILAWFEAAAPKVAARGCVNVICFSGNRDGMSDTEGLEHCAVGIQRLLPIAERHKVVLVMELLNSKVNHPDYMCDHTKWGVELCKKVGSERFKLLYDIYHMQIMEGNLTKTIQANLDTIAHIQIADNPGRNEPGTGEINYPFLFAHLDRIGYTGAIGCEYKPATSTEVGLGWLAQARKG